MVHFFNAIVNYLHQKDLFLRNYKKENNKYHNKLKLLIVDNYDSFTFNLVQIVEQMGCNDFDIVKNDQLEIEAIIIYDKILISPGPGLPKECGKLMELLETYHQTKSILGICIGFQAIAEYFGAELKRFEAPFHGISSKIKFISPKDLIFQGMKDEILVGRYHSWYVKNEFLPEVITVTAIDENCVVMAFKHREFDVRGVQFHPESIMTPEGSKIIENWLFS
ncbi:MAG: aminodeoxychorismate/anthranilate synthase component II [Bacteroidetes bacterium]|nr:aminodeoxychorismate/anthranilate synthase component II [Bacteroidota bacterium]